MNLEIIEGNLIKMFELTKKYLVDSFSVLENANKDPEKLKIDDNSVDDLERLIEEECLKIILKERPFAGDLRKVTGYFKLVEDVERLGDHAEDIMWCSKQLAGAYTIRIEELENMIKEALKMVDNAFKSVVFKDQDLAKEVIKNDDIVDQYYLRVLALLPMLKKNEKLSDTFVIYLTLVAKYVERIADHASNIAEWTIYIKTGYYKNRVII